MMVLGQPVQAQDMTGDLLASQFTSLISLFYVESLWKAQLLFFFFFSLVAATCRYFTGK